MASAPAEERKSKRKRPSEECRSKNFMGTLYFLEDPPADAYEQACSLFSTHVQSFSQFRGLSFQLEKAPTTGRLHLQWNILFKDKVSFTKLKTDLERYGKSPHIEVTAKPQEAWDYTSKAETRVCGPFHVGQGPMKSGARTDLVTFVNDCKEMVPDPSKTEEFEMKHLMVEARYPKLYNKYVAKYESQRTWKTVVVVLWGAAGTGKTRFAHYMAERGFPGQPVYSVTSYPPSRNSHVAWMYGYDRHYVCLFDEYEGQYPSSLFKQLTGDMPCKVKIGDGAAERQWVPSLLIICSNSNPENWYGVGSEYFRRFTSVVHFDYSPDHPLNVHGDNNHFIDVVRHSVHTVSPGPHAGEVISMLADFQASLPFPQPSEQAMVELE